MTLRELLNSLDPNQELIVQKDDPKKQTVYVWIVKSFDNRKKLDHVLDNIVIQTEYKENILYILIKEP